jgi:hypothetical protein
MHRSARLAILVGPAVVALGAAVCLFGGDAPRGRDDGSSGMASRGALQGVVSRGKKTPGKGPASAARVNLAAPTPGLGGSLTAAATVVEAAPGTAASKTAHRKLTREEALKAIREDPAKLAEAIRKVRGGLRSPDPHVRLAAIREARDLHSLELLSDVELLASNEPSAPVRRVVAQILAQDDPQTCEPILRTLAKDGDVMVRLNASFGLARLGDEHEQVWLVQMCETSRTTAPELLPVLSKALEDPALRSPAVIARFQQVANNPQIPQATRDRAVQVLHAKQS